MHILVNPDLSRQMLHLGSRLVLSMDINTGQVRGPNPSRMSLGVILWLKGEAGYCLDAPDKIPGGSCWSRLDITPKGRFESLSQTVLVRDNFQ